MMQLRRQATVDNHIDAIDETAIFRAGKGNEVADVFRRADTDRRGAWHEISGVGFSATGGLPGHRGTDSFQAFVV